VISGKKVLFEIWDISVNENFRLMLPSLYSSVMGVLLVFSVDNRNSFNSVAVWMKQIETFAPENIPIMLVCNKADLLKKQVSQREAQALSEAINVDMVMASARK
jgi:small GTP-binding protein